MRKRSLRMLAVGFALFMGLLAAGETSAQLKVGWSAVSAAYLPIWVPYDSGLFRKYGVEVELVQLNGGSLTAQALISGGLQVGALGGSNVILSKLGGSNLVMFLTVLNTMTPMLITTKDIKEPGDLKGKLLGINRFGTTSDFALQYLFKRWGLDPKKDVKIIQVGNLPEVITATQAGRISGGIVDPTLGIKARQIGLHVMSDMSKLNIDYQTTAIAASKTYLVGNRSLMLSFTKAYVEGIHKIKTERTYAESVLSKYNRIQDKDILKETYDLFSDLIPQKPYPTVQGVAMVLEELGKETANASDFVDNSVLGEVDKSGFIDGLYSGKRSR